MKKITTIISTLSLSCLMVSALFMVALSVKANDTDLGENDKAVVKKMTTDKDKINLFIPEKKSIPQTKLSLDAGFTASGILKTSFNLSSDNTVNVRSVMTYKKGNVTYIIPYNVNVNVQNSEPTMRYHQVQVRLPFRKG